MQINLKLRCISDICLNNEEYVNELCSHIKAHNRLSFQPHISAFESYHLDIEESEDSSIILLSIFLNFNQSVIGNHKLIMIFEENETEYFIINQKQVSIKMMDYYLLDKSTEDNLDNAVKFSASGNVASQASMFLNSFLHSDSSFAFRTIMIIEYIYILRYIHINYPINAIELFRGKIEPTKVFLTHHIENEKIDKFLIEGILELYEVNAYFINNMGEVIINLFLIFVFSHVFNFFFNIFHSKLEKSHSFFFKIFHTIHETIVWSIAIIYFSSNYLNLCFFGALNLIYRPLNSLIGRLNFAIGVLVFIGSIALVVYFIFIIKTIKYYVKSEDFKENHKKVAPEKDKQESFKQIEQHDFSLTNIPSRLVFEENKTLNDILPPWKGKASSTSLKFSEDHLKKTEIQFGSLKLDLSPVKENSVEFSSFNDGLKMKKVFIEKNNDKTNEGYSKNSSNTRKKSKFGKKNQPWDFTTNVDNKIGTLNEIEQNEMKNSQRILIGSTLTNINNNNNKNEEENKKSKGDPEKTKIKEKKNWKNCFKIKNLEMFIGKYEVVYNDFKQNTRFSHYLVIFDLARYVVIAIIVATLEEHYMICVISLLVINLIFFGYLIITFPFREKSKNILTILTELANLSATVAAVIIAICDYNEINDPEIRLNAGWMLVSANIVLIAIILITFLFFITTLLLKLCKSLWKAHKTKTKVTNFVENFKNSERKTSIPERNLTARPLKISLIQTVSANQLFVTTPTPEQKNGGKELMCFKDSLKD